MADLFPPKADADGNLLVPITSTDHRIAVGKFYGAAMLVQALLDQKKAFGSLPGFNAALAILERELAEIKIGLLLKNTRAAAAAGVDLTTHQVYSLDGDNVVCKPVDAPKDEEG